MFVWKIQQSCSTKNGREIDCIGRARSGHDQATRVNRTDDWRMPLKGNREQQQKPCEQGRPSPATGVMEIS